MNLSLTVGDDSTAVAQNRVRAGRLVGVSDITVLDAQHGAHVAFAAGPGIAEQADAVVTNIPGLGLLALAADCVPVVLADPEAGVIAAVHCGWRGLGLGVVPAAVEAMRAHGAERIRAVSGPAICLECYPVGADCVAVLSEQLHAEVFSVCAFNRSGQWHLDVRAGVHAQLHREGIEFSSVRRCTATDPQLFSYRVEGRTGRQGMIVAL